jgi:hypothetical protein
MDLKELQEKFCSNYSVAILNDSKRRAKYKPLHFQSIEDADVISPTLNMEYEKVYTLEIPESRLVSLIEMEAQFYGGVRHQERNMFEHLMAKQREEHFLRNEYPAIKKAWERYSTLLNLVKSGKEPK